MSTHRLDDDETRNHIAILEGAVDVIADFLQFLEVDLAEMRGSDLSQSTLDRLQEINDYFKNNNLWEG